MDKIYICSPYRGDVKENVRRARQYCFCSMIDGIPIAPHLYSTQFLHDACESDRDRGISWGLQLLAECNACVDNVYRIWEEHADTKATQLVFCDLSTPKNDGTFNVYDDMREKLIARGIPAEQIRFIHEATTDAQKKELFGKVRSGEVRVLFGSTPKMGAGTNVQDRLIAIHNLDCPWRPSDVGRILRTFKIKKNVEVTDNGKIII